MRWLRAFPLLTRTLLLVIVGLLFTLSLFGYLSVRTLRESTDRVFTERLRQAQLVAAYMDDHVASAFYLLERAVATEGLNLEDADLAPERRALRELYAAGVFTYDVFITDRYGIVRLVVPDLPQVLGADLSVHPHIRAALTTGQPQVSNLIFGAALPRLLISFVVPVKNRTGEVIGLIGGAMDPSASGLMGIVPTLQPPIAGHIDVVDAQGIVLASTDREHVGEDSYHRAALLPVLRRREPTVGVMPFIGGGEEEPHIVAFVPLSRAPWGVAIAQSKAEALAPISRLQRWLILVGGIVLAGTALFTWLTVQAVVVPIQQLLVATRRLASGDLTTPITVVGQDEVAELAHSFEVMRRKLAAWGEELEAAVRKRTQALVLVAEIARRAASVLDPDQLLQETADAIQQAFGYYDVVLFLVDQEAEELTLKARAGSFARPFPREPHRKIDEIGIIDWVARHGETLLANDVREEPRYRPFLPATRSELCVPIKDGERVIAGINIESDRLHAFDGTDVTAFETLAAQLAIALRNARLFAEWQHKIAELTALHRIATAISGSLNLHSVLTGALEQIVVVTGVDGAECHLAGQEGVLELAAHYGLDAEFVVRSRDFCFRPGVGIPGLAFARRAPVYVADAPTDERYLRRDLARAAGYRSLLCVPLLGREALLGTFMLYSRKPREFPADLQALLMTVGSQFAVAIERALLYEEVRHLSLAIVRALAAAIDARDPYTRGHSEVVARLAVCVAREMGWDGADLELLEFAALLHDVGKIAVPDAVLRKNGPLAPEEWEIVRRHPHYSAQIVEPVAPLKRIIPWIYHHQEWWNGSGYPDGLKGEEIPLAARIIAVVDAYNAMTTERPYRDAMSHEKAVAELRRCAGTQFDPQVVEVFLRVVERGDCNDEASAVSVAQ